MPEVGRLGDVAVCQADAHGCPACPHNVTGPAVQGSPNVTVNSLPVVRQGDMGVHMVCCAGNTWTAQKGSSTVFVNGMPVMRKGDMVQHCGGAGKLNAGSANVNVGG